MGRLPGSWDAPAWGGPWVGLLLAASVLSSSLQPAPAQTILINPQSPTVGGNVSLALENPPQDFVSCNWYRAATTEESRRILTYYPSTPPVQNQGPAYTKRETAGPGCALNIAGLTLNDTGSYMLQMESPTNRVVTSVNLRIYGSGHQSKTPQSSDTTPPVYENLPPAAQAGPVAQPGSPPDTGPTYETLQSGQQDVYEQLRR